MSAEATFDADFVGSAKPDPSKTSQETVAYNRINSSFPSSADDFWAAKPDEVSSWSWLFHPLNPFRFASWAAKLLNKIVSQSKRTGWTFFFQRTIAGWMGVSEQWIREILRRFKTIGVIEDRKIGKIRQYRIAKDAFAPAKAENCGETFGEIEQIAAANSNFSSGSARSSAPDLRYRIHGSNGSEPIIKPDDGIADPIVDAMREADIKYVSQRDAPTLEAARKFGITAVVIGILISKVRLAISKGYENSKINSLKYCLPAIVEFAAVQNGQLRCADGVERPLSETDTYLRYVRKCLNKLKKGASSSGQTTK
jgi:hypothetical protein